MTLSPFYGARKLTLSGDIDDVPPDGETSIGHKENTIARLPRAIGKVM